MKVYAQIALTTFVSFLFFFEEKHLYNFVFDALVLIILLISFYLGY
jgi:hypothetical protein